MSGGRKRSTSRRHRSSPDRHSPDRHSHRDRDHHHKDRPSSRDNHRRKSSRGSDDHADLERVPDGLGGTIKGMNSHDFDPEAAAEKLNKAFKGLGTDEKSLIEVLTSHTNAQRQRIKKKYKTMYGKGVGTNEKCLIEILCTRSNSEIELLREAYFAEFRRNLEGDILSDTGGDFSTLLVSLLNASREESDRVDRKQAEQDAQKLLAAGISKLGTDEGVFNHIMCLRSQPQVAATVEAYKRLSKHDMESDIRKEFSGEIRDALLAVVQCAKNTPLFFAETIHDSMKGFGSNDETIIRVLVSRSEMDLEDIKEEYQRKYKKTLAKSLKEDTSGDYSRLLQKIINPRE